MQLSEIQEKMADPDFSISACSRSTGLHINTLYRIAQGKAKRPNPLTIKELVKYLNKQA
jgi:ActR/RegA family two-component response regulator